MYSKKCNWASKYKKTYHKICLYYHKYICASKQKKLLTQKTFFEMQPLI